MLLVKAVGSTHPDPVINLAGCYKQGDVVVIQDDDFTWGIGELDTDVFAIIKMTGVAKEAMSYLLSSNDESLAKTAANKFPRLLNITSAVQRKTVRRRRYSIDLDTQLITDKAR